MSTSQADFNTTIVEEFRANEGRVGGMFQGMPLLLLHHREQAQRTPQFAQYAEQTARVIPVILLTPRTAG